MCNQVPAAALMKIVYSSNKHGTDGRKVNNTNTIKLIMCSVDVSVMPLQLKLDNENMHFFIHYNVPLLAVWNPRPAVVYWMNQKSRRAGQRTRRKEQ